MEQSVYDIEARVEADHWWFRGRRRLFAAELRALNIAKHARFLDVGIGMGSNLRMLRDEGYRRVTGVNLNPVAIQHCFEGGFTSVVLGDATSLPFAGCDFDVVLATDIVEHIEDDRKSLRKLYRVLVPGGHVLIAVPAFPSLWGLQDVVAHHKRRYKINDLIEKMRSSGFSIRRSFYFNYLLFLPIWLARRVINVLGIKKASENEFNTTALNRLLFWVFALDIWTAPIIHPPFGVSIMVIGEKTRDA
jgi:SAM-dependent methyltransferase